ncbi:MAG: c-type cytochrome [Alphaproteobacteria bacterium]
MKKSYTTIAILGAVTLAIVGGVIFNSSSQGQGRIDPDNRQLVESGKALYAKHCASCHGKNLEGQTPNWRQPLPDGSFPAPPHDASGHTWHHPDAMLFKVTKYSRTQSGDKSFKSNMPAFEKTLSDDEIWAVLSYIKSTWPQTIRLRHDELNRQYKPAH